MLDDGHPGDFQAASREFVDGIGWWMLDGWVLDGNNQHWWLPSTVFVLQTEVAGDVGARDGDTEGDAEYAGDVIDETEVGVLRGDAGADDRRGGVL